MPDAEQWKRDDREYRLIGVAMLILLLMSKISCLDRWRTAGIEIPVAYRGLMCLNNVSSGVFAFSGRAQVSDRGFTIYR
ncbi:hypothetical protein HYDPIDRAFT_114214 [Hydnomerulius pinastri MD-312]|uniref:Uncharacterized protein n=1 Tax=Hydnomerulius pinastri MD-312 TaxID=994086 RepID=A0A0C9WCZ4_9AGAM|nr:hypothetical protein HYDPIDRAFT_114214 [Hydnomerulius pinastri MD-312]